MSVLASTLGDVASWFTDGAHWQGRSGIPNRLYEHVRYSGSAVVIAAAVSLPVAAWLGHRRRFGTLAVTIANLGQTLPSFAVLVLAVQVFAFRALPFAGPIALLVAMTLFAIPPIFVNTYTGVAQVDDALRDAAVGAGMTDLQQLRRVELPVAAPVVLTGVRVAVVQVVSTATLGAYLGVGGLGRYIIDGFSVRDYPRVFAGALLVAVLALLADRSIALWQKTLAIQHTRPAARASAHPIA